MKNTKLNHQDKTPANDSLDKEITAIEIPENLVEENARRNEALKTIYDPITGQGACGNRICTQVEGLGYVWVPEEMLQEQPHDITADHKCFNKARMHYDFEFWCATCATVLEMVRGWFL